MRTAHRHPVRVATIATVALISTGLGVFGTSTAFADTPSPAATATPAATGTPSPATTPRPAATPVATATPVSTPAAATTAGTAAIQGTPGAGLVLDAITSGWPTGTTFTYQWLRGTTPITGATASSYRLQRADVGSTVAVTVTGTAPGDTPTTVTSASTTTIGVPPHFSVPSTVSYTFTVGVPVSVDLSATGTPTPTYTLFPGLPDVPELPAGITFDDGILSGTPTSAGDAAVLVAAESTAGTVGVNVRITVLPGAPAGIGVTVSKAADHSNATSYQSDGVQEGDDVTGQVGESLALLPYLFDRGDEVLDEVGTTATISTSDPADVITADREAVGFTNVTLAHVGPDTITVRDAGFSVSFTVQVSPAVGALAPVSTTTTTTTPGTGSLAFTGSDDSGLVAWAVALLVAGAGITAVRLRRLRRARRG